VDKGVAAIASTIFAGDGANGIRVVFPEKTKGFKMALVEVDQNFNFVFYLGDHIPKE